MPSYKFYKKNIAKVNSNQIKSFKEEMKGFSLNNYYEIPYIDRSYKVNNTPPVFKKNIDVISFFSGAGGVSIVQVMENIKNHAVPKSCSMK